MLSVSVVSDFTFSSTVLFQGVFKAQTKPCCMYHTAAWAKKCQKTKYFITKKTKYDFRFFWCRGRDRCLLTCVKQVDIQKINRNCFELQRTSGFIKPREAHVLEGPHNMPVAFLIIINYQCVQFCHRHWQNLLLTAWAVMQSLQWACSKNATPLTCSDAKLLFSFHRTTGNLRCLLISCQTPTWNVNIGNIGEKCN